MTDVDVAAIRARCERLVTNRMSPLVPRVTEAFDVLECDVPALLDALAEAERQRDDALAKIAAVDEALRINHMRFRLAGLSADAFAMHAAVGAALADPRPPSATPAAETVPPRVAGTGGPQNPTQGRGSGE